VNEKALLLAGPSDPSADRLEKILAVFGVPCERQTAAEFLAGSVPANARILCTAGMFLEAAAGLEKNPAFASGIHSILVHAGENLARLQSLVQKLSGDAATKVVQAGQGIEWAVTSQLPEFCRSMSGLKILSQSSPANALQFDAGKSPVEKIISSEAGVAFARFEFRGIPVFLSTAEVIDVSAPLAARDFDIRVHLLAALPAVLFIRHAFAETCWQTPETCACLVIDDPLLTPRYGFLEFEKLLGLMERYNFNTSIAFIPCNWNRGARSTVELFKNNPQRFSLSIHGCDHTGGEYGCRQRDRLAWKSHQSLSRMERNMERTKLSHDRVMVFPQGVFSEISLEVLKRAGFLATVNSEVISTDPEPQKISVADYWNVAVMNFGGFPIFTRRAPWLGVENFAFDVLLGKPLLICTHHNDFHDDGKHIEEFFSRLSKLNAPLRWMTLAEVARRSYRQRDVSDGKIAVEMFASEILVENHSKQVKRFHVSKRESAPETVHQVRVGGQPVQWTARDGCIALETELKPGEKKTIVIIFKEQVTENFRGESLGYRLKAIVRRRLCEFRDNYVRKKTFSV